MYLWGFAVVFLLLVLAAASRVNHFFGRAHQVHSRFVSSRQLAAGSGQETAAGQHQPAGSNIEVRNSDCPPNPSLRKTPTTIHRSSTISPVASAFFRKEKNEGKSQEEFRSSSSKDTTPHAAGSCAVNWCGREAQEGLGPHHPTPASQPYDQTGSSYFFQQCCHEIL